MAKSRSSAHLEITRTNRRKYIALISFFHLAILGVLALVWYWYLPETLLKKIYDPYSITIHVLETFVVVYLAMMALWFAFRHRFGLYQITQELREVTSDISTHSAGRFPKHLKTIGDLIDDSESSIQILADCVDYGSFFDPHSHKAVFDKLIRARLRSIPIRVVVCGPPQPITRISRFFDPAPNEALTFERLFERNEEFKGYYEAYIMALRGDRDFLGWLREISSTESKRSILKKAVEEWSNIEERVTLRRLTDSDFKSELDACIRTLDRTTEIKFAGNHPFVLLLQLRQKYFDERLAAERVEIKYLMGEHAGVFFWLQDEEINAVFVFADTGAEAKGLGFQTQDSDLLKTFSSIFNEKWKIQPLEADA